MTGSSGGRGSHKGARPAGNSWSGLTAPEPEAAGNRPFLSGLPALRHPSEGRALSPTKLLNWVPKKQGLALWGPLPLSFLSSSWCNGKWLMVLGSNPSSRSFRRRPEAKPLIISKPDFLTSETRIMAVRTT